MYDYIKLKYVIIHFPDVKFHNIVMTGNKMYENKPFLTFIMERSYFIDQLIK